MGLFDLFKKKKKDIDPQLNPGEITEIGIYEQAQGSLAYEKNGKNYSSYKQSLFDSGFAEKAFILATIGKILQYYYQDNKNDVLSLYEKLAEDYTKSEDVIWIFIEIICTLQLPNQRELVETFKTLKSQTGDFNEYYNIEYQKGLWLKSNHHFAEAIALFSSLNKIHEAGWNYYQIAIIYNQQNNKHECLKNLKLSFHLEPVLKEDAKIYPELSNLQDDPVFIELLQ